ncbi:MAG TPA: hypothetical protein VMB34_19900 [Acetobacteraceae bacterium]|nr:hypothetical protein [Acetobacteraceae bacterium]
MTKSDQPRTGAPGTLDKSAQTAGNVSRELAEDELQKVHGGAFDTYMQFMDSTGKFLVGESAR